MRVYYMQYIYIIIYLCTVYKHFNWIWNHQKVAGSPGGGGGGGPKPSFMAAVEAAWCSDPKRCQSNFGTVRGFKTCLPNFILNKNTGDLKKTSQLLSHHNSNIKKNTFEMASRASVRCWESSLDAELMKPPGHHQCLLTLKCTTCQLDDLEVGSNNAWMMHLIPMVQTSSNFSITWPGKNFDDKLPVCSCSWPSPSNPVKCA